MGKIQVMDDSLANKIAAGEVVERPASVVKELVENAIDAGSKKIKVEIAEGGLSLIQVTDDGEGMDEEDLERAFLRHATSKMLSEKDLFRIQTLGFRGEALPSIAAVSKVEVRSRMREALLATTISIQGGKQKEKGNSSHPNGTEIWVRELFYNTPARLKYVKSITTENHHIQDVINRLALAYPDISFTLINEGREILRTSGAGDIHSVIHSIYGLEVAKNVISFQGEHLDFHISGIIAKPEITRGSRNYISVFVNGRYVRSLSLQKAIIEGYHTLLPINRYPIAIIKLEMDPTLVDVNVHPSKLEVRFSKEEELSRWIKEQSRQTLLRQSLIPSSTSSTMKSRSSFSEQGKMNLNWQVRENAYPNPNLPNLTEAIYGVSPRTEETIVVNKEFVSDSKANMAEHADNTNFQPENDQAGPRIPLLEPLSQLHGTYILAQNEEGLYLVDQHAAQERINYEYFRRALSSGSRSGQLLGIPYTYETTKSEAELIRNATPLLEELGIIQEAFGDRSFIVREIPDWMTKGSEEKQIDEIIQLILQGKGKILLADIRDQTAQLMACKASIKANQYLTKQDMASLLARLSHSENPFTCPHGRPILVHFSVYEIEKMFKRVM